MGDNESYNKALRALKPIPFKDLGIEFRALPSGDAPDVEIHVVRMGDLTAKRSIFIETDNEEEKLWMPDHAFLLKTSNNGQDKRYLFDMGLRKNGQYLSDGLKNSFKKFNCNSPHNIVEALSDINVTPEMIDTIVLSHTHFDHIGDLALFPKSTELLLGPDMAQDTKSLAEALQVEEDALSGRKIRFLSRADDDWQQVGCLQGCDLDGSGNFFLLDTPGHRAGHLSALVKSGNGKGKAQYYLFGGDACHDYCFLRHDKPSPKIGLFPSSGDAQRLTATDDDLKETYRSLAKVKRMDEEDNCVAWIAHDSTLDRLLQKRVTKINTLFDACKSRNID